MDASVGDLEDDSAYRPGCEWGQGGRGVRTRVDWQMPHGFGQSRDSWPNSSQLKQRDVLMPVR